jgi:hypothetical protein
MYGYDSAKFARIPISSKGIFLKTENIWKLNISEGPMFPL